MVDGYDAESQVEALVEQGVLRRLPRRLGARGMLVVNLWGGDREFDDTLKRIEAAFPDGTLCLPAESPGTSSCSPSGTRPDSPRMESPWSSGRSRWSSAIGLEFPRFVDALRKMNRHDENRLFI